MAKTDGDETMGRKAYEKELRKLQEELCHLQTWIKEKNERVIIILEGRDAAGKGGTIKAITERVSPRVFRVVALPAPSDREKSQMYLQRYVEHFPAGGEIVVFDRSWYNRAGVEYVMGFCTPEQHRRFLELTPDRREVHRRRRHPAAEDLAGGRAGRAGAAVSRPHRRSDAPVEAQPDGCGVVQAVVRLLQGPRHDARSHRFGSRAVVRRHSNDKKRARLNVISHILSQIPYKQIEHDKVKLPERSTKKKYDDHATMVSRKYIAQKF